MSVALDATVAGASSNTYATEAEVDAYFLARLPLSPPWTDAADPTAAIAMATRTLDAMFQPRRVLMPGDSRSGAYYLVARQWAGAPATSTQRLAWPRTGMVDRNGNAISPSTIPLDLKYAVAEFAGQLVAADRTLDNDVSVQGLKSVKAGSVSLDFKETILPKVLPDAVLNLMPASWFTDEIYELAISAIIDVIS